MVYKKKKKKDILLLKLFISLKPLEYEVVKYSNFDVRIIGDFKEEETYVTNKHEKMLKLISNLRNVN